MGARLRAPLVGRVGLGALLVASAAHAAPRHEIPSDITIHAFVKPDPGRLRIVLRVPLRAMRDIRFPLRGPGYLDLPRVGDALRTAANLWIGDYLEVYEGDERLEGGRLVAARASIPSDRSFGRYETAVAHVTGPDLAAGTDLYWEQAMLDVMFEYPIASPTSDFALHPRLERLALRVVTVLRFITPGGAERVFQYTGNPGLITLDPRWHQAAVRFVGLGFEHILDGIDHLLFLLCLIIPFRRIRPLVAIVTAFTVAHSITLIASAAGYAPDGLWFPPLVETVIAASIVYMAIENILGARVQRRWVVAFGFGLVHGFGFSFALAQNLQFAGTHLAASLLSFNVGVELGQLLVVILMVPVLDFVFRHVARERIGTIVLSALVAHTAWHWMTERGRILLEYDLPVWNLAFVGNALEWLAILLAGAAVAWFVWRRLRGWVDGSRTRAPEPPVPAEK